MFIKKLLKWIGKKKYKKFYKRINNNLKLIWGIKSDSDLSSEPTVWTMNDIDIVYNYENCKYSIGIETILDFYDSTEQKEYIKRLFDKLTEWMLTNNYNTNFEIHYSDVFSNGISLNGGFDSIEELYGCFKILVKGFIG